MVPERAPTLRLAPASSRDAQRGGSLSATSWLRVALVAGLAAAAATIVFELLVAERVVDRAVALEGSAGHHATPLGVPEPFTRGEQRGGLVLGELLLGAAVALLLAGAATFLGPRSRSPRRLWVLMGLAGLWAVVALPALVYPPLPPGVESSLPIGERQAFYGATIAVGIAGFAAAVHVLAGGRSLRVPAAVLLLAAPAVLAWLVFPDPAVDQGAVGDGLLAEFRAVAIGAQVIFWSVLTLAGARLLRDPVRDAAA